MSKSGKADGVYEHRQDSAQPIVHTVQIEGGVVTDAWMWQVMGNCHSSGGWERSVIGKRADDLDLTGYKYVRRLDKTR